MKPAIRIAEIVAPVLARGGFTATTTVDSVEPYAATVEIASPDGTVLPTTVVFVHAPPVVRAYLSGEPAFTGDESLWFSIPDDADDRTIRQSVTSILF